MTALPGVGISSSAGVAPTRGDAQREQDGALHGAVPAGEEHRIAQRESEEFQQVLEQLPEPGGSRASTAWLCVTQGTVAPLQPALQGCLGSQECSGASY